MPAHWICNCDICGQPASGYSFPFRLNDPNRFVANASHPPKLEIKAMDPFFEGSATAYLCRPHYDALLDHVEKWLEEAQYAA